MKDKIKLSIFWIFSFLVITFMMTFSAHAQGNSLPFIAANENIDGFENFIYSLPSSSVSFLSSYFVDAYENGQYFGYDFYEGGRHKFAFYVPQEEFVYSFVLSNDYNDFDITDDYAEMTFSNYIFIKGYIDYPYFYGSYQTNTITTPTTVRFFYGSNKGDGSLLVPNIASQNYNYQLNIYQPVFGLSVVNPPIEIGTAIIPPSPIIPEYPTGTTPPANVPPTYTPQSYTPTTPPTPDFSTAEKTLESIYYYIQWGIADINGQFHMLKENLAGFFEYIGATIQYYGNAILETLNNFIQNFYDNMANLVQPIFDKINYIAEPLDQDIIFDNISTTSIVTNIGIIQSSLSSFQASFTGVSEPSSYTIPIHLENLPSNWFGNQTTQYIDLGVINGTVKDGLRLFVWAMVTYSLVVTIFDSISNYINGGGDES